MDFLRYIGFIMMGIMLIVEFANCGDSDRPAELTTPRIIVTALALMFLGWNWIIAIIVGVVWGFVGIFIFTIVACIVEEIRGTGSSSTSSSSTYTPPRTTTTTTTTRTTTTTSRPTSTYTPPRTTPTYTPTRTTTPRTVEYLLNGQGQSTGRVFRTSDYPGYSEISRSNEGRIFSDSSGMIICTRYIRQ